MTERECYLGFSLFPGIGPKTFKELLIELGTAEVTWNAQRLELRKVLGEKLLEQFLKFREEFNFDEYQTRLDKANVWYVTLGEKEYPWLLKNSVNPPFVLWGRGSKDVVFNQSEKGEGETVKKYAAIVGTRMITGYGRGVTEMITTELVNKGVVIVSGLAFGVDAVAHSTTVKNSGKTIAVLGCGVDCCNPRENQRLYDEIISNGGAVVSEYPLSQAPTPGSFPSRNRIIAGLSDVVIVTEGSADSGALYTADAGFKNSRPVFAVPGPITSQLSKGSNTLIKRGATALLTPDDVLKALDIGPSNQSNKKQTNKKVIGSTPDENRIITLLEKEPLLFDELSKRLDLNASTLGSLLSMMELKGFVTKDDEGRYGL